MIFYLITVRPFKDPIMQSQVIMNEVISFILNFIILLQVMGLTHIDIFQLSNYIMNIIMAAIFYNMASFTLIGIKKLVDWIKKRKINLTVQIPTSPDIVVTEFCKTVKIEENPHADLFEVK
jgi:hypothetical protein